MNRFHSGACLALILAGLGAAVMLVPSEGELALIHFKDKEYEVARRSYEERLAAGDRSVSVIIPLTQLCLQYGDVDRAIELMREFVRDNPNDIEALRQLGKFFQYAERPRDYLTILERITAMESSEASLRELSASYNFISDFDKQILTLKILTEKHPDDAKNFFDLANLQAASGSIADAEATLRAAEQKHPGAVTSESIELHLDLLLDLRRNEEALALASRFLRATKTYDDVVRFSDMMRFKGFPADALRLITPFEASAASYPPLLQELVQVEIANGRTDSAYDRLRRLFEAAKLPALVVDILVDLALSRSEADLAIAIAESHDLEMLPNWLLLSLAETALQNQRTEFLARMFSDLGEAFLADKPVLGAQLAVARGDAVSAAEWIGEAERHESLTVNERVALGNLYTTMGQPDNALRSFAAIAFSPETPDGVLRELATLYLQAGRSEEGLEVFQKLRRSRRSNPVQMGWALVAAAAGDGDEVAAWFPANARQLTRQEVSDLYFAAAEAQHFNLAVLSAERLFAIQRGPSTQRYLATAFTAAGRPLEALPLIRPLLNGDADVEILYLEALNAARGAGAPVDDELKLFWGRRLEDSGLSEGERNDVVFALMDLQDFSTVLPAVERLAHDDAGKWLFAFVDIAVKSNQEARLVKFLQSELDEELREDHVRLLLEHGGYAPALKFLSKLADKGADEWIFVYEEAAKSLGLRKELAEFWIRRGNVNKLLELGEKRAAEELLLKLASTRGPGSEELAQLLYLWGPRPGAAALDWMEARGRAARAGQSGERAEWMKLLTNAGAPARAMRLANDDPAVVNSTIEALLALKDTAGLADLTRRVAETETDPGKLRRVARTAKENGLAEAARAGFEKLLSVRPEDRDALKEVGAMALWEGDFTTARQLLTRLMALGDADSDTNFYFGELLAHDRDPRARAYYAKALEKADAPLRRAQLLERIGRFDEAFGLFDTLLQADRDNLEVRSEYVFALMQAGRYDDAKRILNDER